VRRFLFTVIAALTVFGVSNTALPQELSLAELKAAAERGESRAQDTLGDVFFGSLDYTQAAVWYRKAAAQGIVHSQYRLAHILIGWAKSPMAKKEASAMHADEAIPWLVKAANQDHKLAQVELGQVYEEGRFVVQDLVQAYKWYSLGAVGSPVEFAANLGKAYRDRLILKLTQAQIAAGDKLIAAFVPNSGQTVALPEPAYVRQVRLTGLSGALPHRLAIINGKTLGTGESATLKLDGRAVVIRCVSIGEDVVTITIDGLSGSRELHLSSSVMNANPNQTKL
jgi:hypothetical protein